jgi:hypothetical protein
MEELTSKAGRKVPEPSPELLAIEAALEALSDDQLDAQYQEVVADVTRRAAEHAAKEEAKLFFHQPSARADFSHWAKCSYWQISEAVALVLGKEPKYVNETSLRPYVRISTFVSAFNRLADLAERAVAWNQLTKPIGPGAFIAWAKRYDIAVPAELEAAVVNYGHFVGDWKTLYDSTKKQLDEARRHQAEVSELVTGLNNKIEALKAYVASLPPQATRATAKKGIDPREVESLRTLAIAMAIVGYKYDPTEKRSDKIAEIVQDIESLGLSLDSDTVRRHLKTSAALVPREGLAKKEQK